MKKQETTMKKIEGKEYWTIQLLTTFISDAKLEEYITQFVFALIFSINSKIKI